MFVSQILRLLFIPFADRLHDFTVLLVGLKRPFRGCNGYLTYTLDIMMKIRKDMIQDLTARRCV